MLRHVANQPAKLRSAQLDSATHANIHLVTNGTFGVIILSNGADLGALGDPGNNTFTGNLQYGVQLQERFTESAINLAAVGNTWNATTQGSDALGHYPVGTIIKTQILDIQGKNVSLAKKESTQTPLKIVL